MKNQRTHCFAISLLFVLLSSLFPIVQVGAKNSAEKMKPGVQFRLLNGFVIVLPVKLNGEGPYNFIFDTAATTTTVDPALAQSLNLATEGKTSLVTQNGIKEVAYTSIKSLTIGDRQFQDTNLLIAELKEAQSLDPTIKGILGGNVTARLNYFIDYKKKELILENIDEVGGLLSGMLVPFKRDNNRIVVQITDVKSKQNSSFVLDSAIPHIILFKKNDSTPKLAFSYSKDSVRVGTTAGESSAQMILIEKFQIGSELLSKKIGVIINDQSNSSSRLEEGLIPTNIFDCVYVNNKEGLAMFNPRK